MVGALLLVLPPSAWSSEGQETTSHFDNSWGTASRVRVPLHGVREGPAWRSSRVRGERGKTSEGASPVGSACLTDQPPPSMAERFPACLRKPPDPARGDRPHPLAEPPCGDRPRNPPVSRSGGSGERGKTSEGASPVGSAGLTDQPPPSMAERFPACLRKPPDPARGDRPHLTTEFLLLPLVVTATVWPFPRFVP